MIKNSIQEGREPGVAVVRCQRTTVKVNHEVYTREIS